MKNEVSQVKKHRFHSRDLAEIAIGACVMAFPIAVTEEVWKLGEELSLIRALLFAFASMMFLGLFIYFLYEHAGHPVSRKIFLQRVASTYFVTFLICAILLFGIDRVDFLNEPFIALKRTILVAFPASFAATVVDSFSTRADRH